MKKRSHTTPRLILCLLPCLLLAACGGSTDKETKKEVSKNVVLDNEEPAIGTAVTDVIDTTQKDTNDAAGEGYQDVLWDDLVPEGFEPQKIFDRFKEQIEAAPEGSKEERELYDKVMAEYNSAGAKQSLNGKQVRIPGYVAPLDTNGDMVSDFLLVPYYGSCIHSPPPPAHQTVMVIPEADKSVSLNDIYRPVWVIGEIEVEDVVTDLAKASYQIKNAQVIPYTQPSH